jgi:hypothetical protein
MNGKSIITTAIGILIMACQADAMADSPLDRNGLLDSLGGRAFKVVAEIVYTADPVASGFEVGDTFDNCYIFEDDNVWIDPLFPGPGAAVPGGWVQHTEGPSLRYTATIVDTVLMGMPLLTQTGIVSPSRGESRNRFIAYTTVWTGAQPFVEVVSRGEEVPIEDVGTECPAY